MRQHLNSKMSNLRTGLAVPASVVGLFVYMAVSASAFAVVSKSDEGSLKQLGELVAAQHDSLAKIQSYELTMTEQFSYNSSSPDVQSFNRTTEHHERTQGVNTWVVRTEQTSSNDNGHNFADKAEERLVANDRYVAYWPVGTPGAYACEYHASSSLPDKAVSEAKGLNARSPMRNGFGDGELTLSELYDRASGPDKVKLHVNKEGALYSIMFSENAGKSSEEITVDPAKGFLITRVIGYSNGSVNRELTVEPKEVAAGVWFPHVWEETDFNLGKINHAKSNVRDHTRTEISSIAINPAFADGTFKLSAIKLEPSVRICVKDASGNGRPTFLSQAEFVARTATQQKVALASFSRK